MGRLPGDRRRGALRCASPSPETTEKETWGERSSHPGHPTFRVRDKIFAIMAADCSSRGTIRTSMDEQAALRLGVPGGGAPGCACRGARMG